MSAAWSRAHVATKLRRCQFKRIHCAAEKCDRFQSGAVLFRATSEQLRMDNPGESVTRFASIDQCDLRVKLFESLMGLRPLGEGPVELGLCFLHFA